MPFIKGEVAGVAAAVTKCVMRLQRGAITLGIVPDADRPALEQAIRAQLGALAIPPEAAVLLHSPTAAPPIEELHRLNRSRDLLLRGARLVLLMAGDEAGLRAIREHTIDLTTTLDLAFEVTPTGTPGDRAALREALRQRALTQSARVDLSGLLPSDVGAHRLRVEDIYMELVEVQPDGLRRETEATIPLPRLLLIGQPGAGKTTFLRMLAHEYARPEPADRLAIGARVPVLVPLPAYARAREERRAALTLLEFVGDWLVSEGIPGAGALAEAPDDLLLLLDGLDEVRGADTRRAIVEEVRRLPVADGPAVVLSGRTLVLDDLTEEQTRAFALRGTRAPDPHDIESFLRRFFTARRLPAAEEQARHAAVQVGADPELAELARTPLLLVFLALLHELEGRIPDRRFLLYHKIAEILLDRWERARARARGAGVPGRSLALGDTRRVIGALAWWMIEGGRDEVSTSDLYAELTRIERARGATPEEAAARAAGLAEVLQSGSALLASAGDGRWRFVHATLAEYFAGVEFARGGARWEQVLRDIFRTDWQEIVVFGAGELGQRGDDSRLGLLASALLRKHARGGRYGASHVSLIGAVLREDPGFPPPQLRMLVERFVQLCFEPRYWPRSRPAVAWALRDTARAAPQRTWYPLLREQVRIRLGAAAVWREDHDALAGLVVKVLTDLDLDPDPVIAALVAQPDGPLTFAGWRARYARAAPAEKPAILTAALEAMPGRGRFEFTGDFADLLAWLHLRRGG